MTIPCIRPRSPSRKNTSWHQKWPSGGCHDRGRPWRWQERQSVTHGGARSPANRPAISGGSISIRARGGEIRKTRPAVVVTANIREDRGNTAAHKPNSIGLCLSSIRPWHAEYVLADIGEDQIGRDRGRLVEADLAPFALNVVFAGKGKAAIGRHRRLGGAPSRFGS